jgi:hypothetical protein
MMEKILAGVLRLLRFLGISLLIALGLFALVSLSFLIWGPMTNTAYSERMFWVGLAAIGTAAPAVLSFLSTSQGYYNSPFTAGQDAKVAQTIIEDGRKSMDQRTKFVWRMVTVGAFGIAFAALIDLLGR